MIDVMACPGCNRNLEAPIEKSVRLVCCPKCGSTRYLSSEQPPKPFRTNDTVADQAFKTSHNTIVDDTETNRPHDPEPKTPFTMPEYPNPDNSKAVNSFLNLAEEKSQNADRMSGIASKYVFFTTVYAGISFLEGIGRVFPSKKIQTVFLIMGIVMFSVTTIILFLTLPIAPFSII